MLLLQKKKCTGLHRNIQVREIKFCMYLDWVYWGFKLLCTPGLSDFSLKVCVLLSKACSYKKTSQLLERSKFDCTNQQLPQRGGAVPDPVWVWSKWLLAFPRVPGSPGIPLHFFALLPPEQLQKGSSQLLRNRSPVFFFSFLQPFFVSSFFFS